MLALIFHELTTNAAKYGALSAPHGSIALAWRNRGGRAEFDWVESGGPPPAASRRQGFGTTLLRKGLRQFDGSVDMDFARGGLHCRFSLALPPASTCPGRVGSADLAVEQPHLPESAPTVHSVTGGGGALILRPRRVAGKSN